jgi:hypothetical protein
LYFTSSGVADSLEEVSIDMIKSISIATIISLAFMVFACSGPVKEERGQTSRMATKSAPKAQKIKSIDGVKGPGIKLDKGDMNGDGKTDVWKYTKDIAGNSPGEINTIIVKKEADLNFDGRKDVLIEFDELERMTREVFDFDFDGIIDQENHYQDNKIKEKWIYSPTSQKVFIWKYFENGALSKVKQDSNGDGLADNCEDWFKGQRLIRKGRDTTKDGECDEWKTIQ